MTNFKIFIIILWLPFNVYSQKKEMEFLFNPAFFLKNNISNRGLQLSAHYKYLPEIKLKYLPFKLPFILSTGMDYIQNRNNWENFKMQKLIIPCSINIFGGDNNYKLYTGIGLYGGFNFNNEENITFKSTLWQVGGVFNFGFQFKIINNFYGNVDYKYFRDIYPTYIDKSKKEGDFFMKIKSFNIGLSYQFKKAKNK